MMCWFIVTLLVYHCGAEVVHYKSPTGNVYAFESKDLDDYVASLHLSDDVTDVAIHAVIEAEPDCCADVAEIAEYYTRMDTHKMEDYEQALYSDKPPSETNDRDLLTYYALNLTVLLLVGFLLAWIKLDVFGVIGKRNSVPRRAPRKAVRNRSPARKARNVFEQAKKSKVSHERVIPGGAEHTCVVCWDARRNTLLEPCRHVCVCSACAERLNTCPMCRESIDTTMQVFI